MTDYSVRLTLRWGQSHSYSYSYGYQLRHDHTIGTLDMLKACDACTDMGQL